MIVQFALAVSMLLLIFFKLSLALECRFNDTVKLPLFNLFLLVLADDSYELRVISGFAPARVLRHSDCVPSTSSLFVLCSVGTFLGVVVWCLNRDFFSSTLNRI